MDLAERKARLRAAMRERGSSVAVADAEAAARAVAARVAGLAQFAGARVVGLYAAVPGELPSRPLYEQALAAGKSLRFPCVSAPHPAFAAIRRWEDLRAGRYAVPEPPHDAEPLPPGDLVLVPGLAFDRAGRRLGRGAGWYDRALSEPAARGAFRVGVAYDFQVVDEVPSGPGDEPMELVVTERDIYRASEAGP